MTDEKKIEHEASFTKQQVIDGFITQLRSEANRQFEGAEKSFKISADMDGKMQSRYDTQKEDHAADGNMKLAAGQKLVQKVTNFIEKPINETGEERQGTINEGSVFLVRDLVYGGEEWFFLSDMAGGCSITIGGNKITGLNPESPLGAFSKGEEVGKTIKYTVHGEEQKFKVLNII